MSTGTIEQVDTAILEALDYEPPCESKGHNHPYSLPDGRSANGHTSPSAAAAYRFTAVCPRCGSRLDMLVCEGHRAALGGSTYNRELWHIPGGCGKPSPLGLWALKWEPLLNHEG
jgi:hypothetical protein